MEAAQLARQGEAEAKRKATAFQYFHLIELVDRERKANNIGRAAELLDQCPSEMRGWEWCYLNRLIYPSPLASFQVTDEAIINAVYDPQTQQLHVLTESGGILIGKVDLLLENGLLPVEDQSPDWIMKQLGVLENDNATTPNLPTAQVGGRLVTGHQDGSIQIMNNMDSPAPFSNWKIFRMRAHSAAVTSLATNQNEDRLISGGRDGYLNLWGTSEVTRNTAAARLLRKYRAHVTAVKYVTLFFNKGTEIISVGGDGTVKLWSTISPESNEIWVRQERRIHSVAFSPNGDKLAVLDHDRLRYYEFPTRELIFETESGGYRLALNASGDELAVAGFQRAIRIFETATGIELNRLNQERVWALTYNPQGKLFAPTDGIGSRPHIIGNIIMWDFVEEAAKKNVLMEDTDGFSSVAISPDGSLLAAARTSYKMADLPHSYRGKAAMIMLWDLKKDELVAEIGGHENCIWRLAFSPDGKWLASGAGFYKGTGLGEVKLWDLETLQEKLNYPVEESCVFALAFTPDSKRLASAGGAYSRKVVDGGASITLWDLDEGISVFQLRGHENTIYDLAFSPDGSYLATASQDGTVRLWEAPGVDGLGPNQAVIGNRTQTQQRPWLATNQTEGPNQLE